MSDFGLSDELKTMIAIWVVLPYFLALVADAEGMWPDGLVNGLRDPLGAIVTSTCAVAALVLFLAGHLVASFSCFLTAVVTVKLTERVDDCITPLVSPVLAMWFWWGVYLTVPREMGWLGALLLPGLFLLVATCTTIKIFQATSPRVAMAK